MCRGPNSARAIFSDSSNAVLASSYWPSCNASLATSKTASPTSPMGLAAEQGVLELLDGAGQAGLLLRGLQGIRDLPALFQLLAPPGASFEGPFVAAECHQEGLSGLGHVSGHLLHDRAVADGLTTHEISVREFAEGGEEGFVRQFDTLLDLASALEGGDVPIHLGDALLHRLVVVHAAPFDGTLARSR